MQLSDFVGSFFVFDMGESRIGEDSTLWDAFNCCLASASCFLSETYFRLSIIFI